MWHTENAVDNTSHLKNWIAVCALVLSVGAANASTLVTYKFVDATANFTFDEPSNPSYPATLDIHGFFQVNPVTQTVVSIDVWLSGLPSFLSSWNTSYPTILDSFWTSQQFLAVDSDGNNGFQPHFLNSGDGRELDPLISVLLYTQQWGPVYDVSVTGGVVEIAATPLPAAFTLFATGLGALGLLAWRRKWKCAAA